MSKIIAVCNQKGGVGKTTTAVNLSAYLADLGKTVLLIDTDPQGNATAGLGIDRKDLNESIYDVLFGKKGIEEVIFETNSGIHLAPSSINLLAAETHMAEQADSMNILKENLSRIRDKFDYESSYIDYIWPKHDFRVVLPQALIVAMEDQARWRIDNKLTDATEVPNYLDYVYLDALEEIKPEAIGIIR